MPDGLAVGLLPAEADAYGSKRGGNRGRRFASAKQKANRQRHEGAWDPRTERATATVTAKTPTEGYCDRRDWDIYSRVLPPFTEIF